MNIAREEKLTLALLEAIEDHPDLSQRAIARRLGVALGLANAYLKRCVRKGLVKVGQAPPNRYLYYLTPKGFTEKSQLTARYLVVSLDYFRQASESCDNVLAECIEQGVERTLFYGDSEIAEIAFLRSLNTAIEVIGLYDIDTDRQRFFSKPVWRKTAPELQQGDAVMITDLHGPRVLYERVSREFKSVPVFVPDILESASGKTAVGNSG